MTKHARPRCRRCPRKATFEAVYQPATSRSVATEVHDPADGTSLPDAVADLLCGRHLLDVSSVGPVKVRRLRTSWSSLRSWWKRCRSTLPGHRTAWTPLSLLADRERHRAGDSRTQR